MPASEKSKAIIPYYVDIHTDILRTYIGGMQGIRRHIHISTENINHFEERHQLTIFCSLLVTNNAMWRQVSLCHLKE